MSSTQRFLFTRSKASQWALSFALALALALELELELLFSMASSALAWLCARNNNKLLGARSCARARKATSKTLATTSFFGSLCLSSLLSHTQTNRNRKSKSITPTIMLLTNNYVNPCINQPTKAFSQATQTRLTLCAPSKQRKLSIKSEWELELESD